MGVVNVIVWIVQIMLALAFVAHGLIMLNPSRSPATSKPPGKKWRGGMTYVLAIQPANRRIIGVLEIAAAVGLILPQLTGILPWLTPLAATGLAILMLAAVAFHANRGEYVNILLDVILLLMSAFVAFMRWFVLPG